MGIQLRGAGLDSVQNLITDGYIRPIVIDGEIFISLVDLMAVFGEDNRQAGSRARPFNARRYWSDHKKGLLSKDRQLYDSVVQLKARALDGKVRTTDFAPLWAAVFIVLLMDTDQSTAFKKRIARFTDAEIKYRMLNVAHGSEWAADSVHEAMADLEPPQLDSPYNEQGYINGAPS